MTEPTENLDTVRPNWWKRRSKLQKIAIVVASLIVLIAIIPVDDANTDASDKKKASNAGSAKDAGDDKPEPVADAAKKPTKPADPFDKLEADMKKKVTQQSGKGSFVSADCSADAGERFCLVQYRMGATWSGKEDEIVRDMGGMFHELFRDTNAEFLTLNALGDTTNALGKTKKDDKIATIGLKRTGWEEVDWDNLQYQEPTNLRLVAESYAIFVKG